MTSTLTIRKTPKPSRREWHFKQPVKGMIGRKFYDHDGSLSGGQITVGRESLEWFEGVLAAFSGNIKERKDWEAITEILRDGDTIDMWIEN